MKQGIKMIDGLIAGKLHGDPEQRLGKNGKPFVVAKVLAASSEGESLIVNVIAFDASVCRALMVCRDAESVALTGALAPRVWTDKQGAVRPSLDMVAQRLLSVHDAQRSRQSGSETVSQATTSDTAD
jgi:single-stranded DNA-binding protein